MNVMKSVEPATVDLAAAIFDAAMSMDEMRQVEVTCRSFGVQRRVMLMLATKSRSEMAEAMHNLKEADEEGIFALLEFVADYVEHLEKLMVLTKTIEARAIIAAHDIFGLSFDETESWSVDE